MKKRLVVLLAGLLTVLSMGFGSAQFSDVPAGHWAKEAVEKLADEGIILGFPDGTFRGNEGLTRYQAALIIFRVLETIREEQLAQLDEETLTALRNAVQELAAELSSLGVRVGALEDNAATKDDVARLEAAINELRAQPVPEPGVDEKALRELAERVEAASIAADTALAQAQQLNEQLGAVEGDLAALRSLVEANADSIKALNDLAVLLNQDVLELQDRVTALEKVGQPDVSGLASQDQVVAVQEFATALRNDLVNLSNRVSALDTQVADIDERLQTVEANVFTVTGSVNATYEVRRSWGAMENFDIDRVIPDTAFSSGDGNNNDLIVDEEDLGDVKEGATDVSVSLEFATQTRDGTSTPGGLNLHEAVVEFGITPDYLVDTDGDGNADAVGYVFYVKDFDTVFSIGNAPLTFSFGQNPTWKFTEYLGDNDENGRGDGFVATFEPGFGTFTVVYGSKGADDGDNEYFRGARFATNLGDNIHLGASVLEEGADFPNNPDPRQAFGVDASVTLGPITASGEFVSSKVQSAAEADTVIVAKVELEPSESFSATAAYFSVDPDFDGTNNAGMSNDVTVNGLGGDDNEAEFGANTTGFEVTADVMLGAFEASVTYKNQTDFQNANGASSDDFTRLDADASLALGVFTLEGNFTNYTNATQPAESVMGASASLNLAAFTLKGFFDTTSVGGVQVEQNADAGFGDPEATTQFGVELTHDGSAENALIGGLDLTARYTAFPVAGGDDSEILVYGDLDAKLGIINLNPIFRFRSLSGATPVSTTKFGVQANTEPFALPLEPSLMGGYVTRSTNDNSTPVSETAYYAGLEFNKFLFENSTAKVAYGAYMGSNINNVLVGSAENAFDASADNLYANTGALEGRVTGLYFTWTYYDLTFDYADFNVDNNGTITHAQAFKMAYEVEFGEK
ncbi:S-layer homology domain-containing protein [Marinithermus hydrothermalis]|uniref:S-layer domain-containing protein n=1 Tax=Marinithermus hydrothermalis (strain DSM 14884 / JCM 11576 / T1) TaxID=869210 RepID=F2NLR7_MARHT|nr:S-layer homology domain-containing protein [Marinithermus hydrothermalis]AEB10897.1 S-layer domain-containing protein [Marinithermus hydrothermalis DSM 14884]